MAALKFASSHNMVAFLDKPTESDGFEQIVDFLNAHPIKYALTVNPTIYTACIKQFWATKKVKTVNGEVQIQALVDKKKVIIIETSVRSDLLFEDAEGTECLPNAIIFEQLTLMGVPTHSNDPLISGEDRLKLNKLMELCTSLSQRVIDLEKTKTSQAAEITELKKRVKKLEGKRKSKLTGMKRLFKIEVTLVDETQGRNDEEMFDTGILDGEEVFAEHDVVEKEVSTSKVTTDSATTTIVDELTLAQTLIEIKAAKPNAVTTAATTTTTTVTRPKARGVAKDKGKAKMVEPEKPLKKKDQIIQREEDANIAEWDNVQAMMDADYELATRLQAEEQGELSIEEKSRLFVELMNKRKKHFARLRVEEQRRKPPTKAQKRNTMSTYLKNMAGYKHNQLKTKSFKDIQMLFDKEMKRVNTFVDMDTELVKGSETRIEGSSKRAGEELESENLKKQKLDENVEAEVDDDQEEAEMKKHMEIVPDDEVAIDAIPLATKPPIIVDWKIIKEGKMGYFQIIRADGSSKRYSSMIQML
ncbi:hypothetical protein Tco_0734730 [Tanacetum coccineum]